MKALLAIALLFLAASSFELVDELTEPELIEFDEASKPKDWTEMSTCQWETFTIPGFWENWTGGSHFYNDVKLAKNLGSYAEAVRVGSNYIRRQHTSYHGSSRSSYLSACTYLYCSSNYSTCYGHTI
jgi:hypothetical protein